MNPGLNNYIEPSRQYTALPAAVPQQYTSPQGLVRMDIEKAMMADKMLNAEDAISVAFIYIANVPQALQICRYRR